MSNPNDGLYAEDTLISVVVPVYNMEHYLDRCIDSIIKQTYKQLEIIIVDDGSTDASPGICDRYAANDLRVKIIHQKNGGLSDARNTGIELATGTYITFVDSDDYISVEFIENMYRLIKLNDADIAVCGICNTSEEGNAISKEKPCSGKTYIWDSREALRHMLLQMKMTTSAWGKLYRTELFREIRYPKGKLYEDLATTYKLIALSDKTVLTENKMYYYFQRKGSIQNSQFDLKKLDELEIAEELKEYIVKHYPELETAAVNRLVGCYFHILFFIDDERKYQDIVIRIKQVILNYRLKMILGKDVCKKVRFGCLSTYLGFGFTRKLYFKAGMRGKINF